MLFIKSRFLYYTMGEGGISCSMSKEEKELQEKEAAWRPGLGAPRDIEPS